MLVSTANEMVDNDCVLALSVAIAVGASLAWRVHRQRASEQNKLSAVADETRTRAEQGAAAAQNTLGNLYLVGKGVPKDYAQAVLWYRKAAEQGDRKGEFNLGEMYELGEGAPKDYAEAIHWLRKSADQNDTRAQIALGHMYFNGEGVTQDEGQGFAWYRKAAEAGHVPAQQFVGWMYYNGRGVPKDYTEAAAWYQKAADQGDAVAQTSLGYMCWYGIGVEKDWIGSLRWYRMAAAQGEPSAVRFLKSFRPAPRKRYLEVGLGFVAFFLGVVFALPSWESMLPGRRLRDWRQPFEALLSLIFFAYSGLNLYASEHVIRYLPFHNTFHLVTRVLLAAAVLIILTVVLPAKRRTPQSSPAGAESS